MAWGAQHQPCMGPQGGLPRHRFSWRSWREAQPRERQPRAALSCISLEIDWGPSRRPRKPAQPMEFADLKGETLVKPPGSINGWVARAASPGVPIASSLSCAGALPLAGSPAPSGAGQQRL